MFSSDKTNNSIRNALFDAAVQLSVPTVLSTATVATKVRATSNSDVTDFPSRSRSPSTQTTRSSLSTVPIHVSRRSDFNKVKFVRDIATQCSNVDQQDETTEKFIHRPNQLNFIVDKNNNPTGRTPPISETSREYLSLPTCPIHHSSPSASPTRQGKSLKTTLLGIWQGINSDELRSATSSPMDPKFFEERTRSSTPSWRAFTKVVTSLLTFTRTYKERYQWIQLVGHPGTFREGLHSGYVLKQLSEHERRCCEFIQTDILKDFVPKYNGTVKDEEGKSFIELEDLLSTFHDPCIMDCKMGVRTYLEEDLEKSEQDPEPREDLYKKMIAIDPDAPTAKEKEEQKLLKPRYMIWRESLSSSQELGFRIEAIKKSPGLMSKDFQRIKERDEVYKQIKEFLADSLPRAIQYLQRLIDLRSTCLQSNFFRTHELIGSSLLFVHDRNKASIWMIDFGKTRPLISSMEIHHDRPWTRGSHEDGYFIGLDNLISLFQRIIDEFQTI